MLPWRELLPNRDRKGAGRLKPNRDRKGAGHLKLNRDRKGVGYSETREIHPSTEQPTPLRSWFGYIVR